MFCFLFFLNLFKNWPKIIDLRLCGIIFVSSSSCSLQLLLKHLNYKILLIVLKMNLSPAWKGSLLDTERRATSYLVQLLCDFFSKPSARTDARCALTFPTIACHALHFQAVIYQSEWNISAILHVYVRWISCHLSSRARCWISPRLRGFFPGVGLRCTSLIWQIHWESLDGKTAKGC